MPTAFFHEKMIPCVVAETHGRPGWRCCKNGGRPCDLRYKSKATDNIEEYDDKRQRRDNEVALASNHPFSLDRIFFFPAHISIRSVINPPHASRIHSKPASVQPPPPPCRNPVQAPLLQLQLQGVRSRRRSTTHLSANRFYTQMMEHCRKEWNN